VEFLSLSLGYVKNKEARKAIDLFHKIKNPNEVILLLVFNACAQLQTKEALDLVKEIAINLPNSLDIHPNLMTSLLDALMKCGDVKSAEAVFIRMTKKSVGMYGAMIKGSVFFR
jgi:pentatricopeptide repeat protein